MNFTDLQFNNKGWGEPKQLSPSPRLLIEGESYEEKEDHG
jgi:hypothetical protein